jgi:hypothetical protein
MLADRRPGEIYHISTIMVTPLSFRLNTLAGDASDAVGLGTLDSLDEELHPTLRIISKDLCG